MASAFEVFKWITIHSLVISGSLQFYILYFQNCLPFFFYINDLKFLLKLPIFIFQSTYICVTFGFYLRVGIFFAFSVDSVKFHTLKTLNVNGIELLEMGCFLLLVKIFS